MARDKGLEELMREELDAEPRLTERSMFGGRSWLLNGNFLCGARHDGMLVRLGPIASNVLSAIPDMRPMVVGTRQMHGWFWAGPVVFGDDVLRKRLLDAALAYVGSLPSK